jgi:hypothetical protein
MGIGTGLAAQARQLVGGFLLLMQTMSRLTAAELRANAGALRAPLLMLLAATGLLFTALALGLVAAVLALTQLVGPVAACLIVALVSAVTALALARHGLSRLSATDLAPRRSMTTLRMQIDRFVAKNNRKAPQPKEPRP